MIHLCVVITCAHGGHINVCAADERPVSAAVKRISCKQDPKCIHESQCGCIPKDCTCGNEACIFAGELDGGVDDHDGDQREIEDHDEHHHDHTHAEGEKHSHAGGNSPHHHASDGSIIPDETTRPAAAAGTSAGTPSQSGSGASKHHLVDDDSEGPAHTHKDGTTHGHPGGDMAHHHDASGGIVFDLPKKPAKLVMNKGKLLMSPQTTQNNDDTVDADTVHEQPAALAPTHKLTAKDEKAKAAAGPPAGDSAPAAVATVESRSSKANTNGTGTPESPASNQIRQV